MDVLQRRLTWLVRFALDCAAFRKTGWIAPRGFLTLEAAWIVATGLAVKFSYAGTRLGGSKYNNLTP
jgi:hypothetical protein